MDGSEDRHVTFVRAVGPWKVKRRRRKHGSIKEHGKGNFSLSN